MLSQWLAESLWDQKIKQKESSSSFSLSCSKYLAIENPDRCNELTENKAVVYFQK